MAKNDNVIKEADIQNDLEQLSNEELKALVINFEKERKELNIFVDEIALMRQNQKAGDIEWFIPTSKFTDVYVTMAKGVSKQVGDHISMKTASLLFMEKLTGGKRHG